MIFLPHMEYEYSNKFLKDLERYKNKRQLLNIIGRKVQHIKKAESTNEIHELVSIRKTKSHYRIKIKLSEKEVYRVGIVILKKTIWFACIDKDKRRFYKRFP